MKTNTPSLLLIIIWSRFSFSSCDQMLGNSLRGGRSVSPLDLVCCDWRLWFSLVVRLTRSRTVLPIRLTPTCSLMSQNPCKQLWRKAPAQWLNIQSLNIWDIISAWLHTQDSTDSKPCLARRHPQTQTYLCSVFKVNPQDLSPPQSKLLMRMWPLSPGTHSCNDPSHRDIDEAMSLL